MTTLPRIALLLILLLSSACANAADPDPPPGSCRNCPTQQERVDREIERAKMRAMRRVLYQAERAVWDLVRGR
jgi:hypothetical protein